MADFVELGIEGADKLIDKHFHKLPDSALHRDTYHPRNIKKKIHRRRHDSSSSSSESDSEDIEEGGLTPKMQSSGSGGSNPSYPISYPPGSSYPTPPIYSRQPPLLRPQYTPTPPSIEEKYPPSQQSPRGRFRDYDEDYHSDPYRSPRRPKAVTRRSSSYHGRDRSPDSMQLAQRRRGSMSNVEKTKDVAKRYGFKEELENHFTKSPAGMTGGVIGAVLGGWAARKAQTAYGKPEKQEKGVNPVLTLLGAAAGGLAVNALVDKVQHRHKATEDKQEKWKEKFGSESEGGDRDRPRRGRRDREYSGENNGRGYQPYGSGYDR